MSASVLAPGLVVADSYEIERQLGQGGMGEVWLARHRRLAGKQVAIKVLRTSGQLSPDALSRFRREAEIAARLEHPNLVQVLDFNTLPSGEPFLVMEYLKGGSLAQRLQGAPLPVEEVMEIVRQVGAALQAAHAGGVVHRDLKPENIFLLPTALGDQIKVLDFGISKLADSSSVQTTDAVLLGTPLYMSPEQALGNNREVSAQSDVFSLASITYEALTGTPPFLADSIAKIVFRIAYEKHRPLLDARPDLPPSVAQAVERGLAKDRAQRTPDMGTFVSELTGRALAVPRQVTPGPQGLYTPGLAVSDSLAGGATMPRGSSQPAAAPAAPAAAPTSKVPDGAPATRGLALPAVLVVLALGAVALLLRPPRPEPGAPGMADAGAAGPSLAARGLDDGGEVEADAGAAAPSTTDAGLESSGPPASSPRDAGVKAGPRAGRADPSEPLTDSDRVALARLEQRLERGDHQGLLMLHVGLTRELMTATARLKALQALTRAACVAHDDRVLPRFIDALRPLASSGTFAASRRECLAVWPDAELRWE